jgi:hypothetical protein
MADAYLYASEGRYSKELDLLKKIDRFGFEAVTGRKTFYFGELRRMMIAENIVRAYEGRAAHKGGWAAWSTDNPELSELLHAAEMLCL